MFKNMKDIILENDLARCVILPELGGKIASFYLKEQDFELFFQNKEEMYKLPKIDDDFAEFDASGFDDAFPNINAEYVDLYGKSVLYPDHGEIWSACFDFKGNKDSIDLYYESERLPYSYHKNVRLEDNRLILSYKITNTDDDISFPYIWTMHGLTNCEENMEIIFPEGTKEVLNAQDSKYLGKIGTVHSFPATRALDNTVFYLNEILPHRSNNTNKYYINGPVSSGECGIYYPSKQVQFKLTYDKKALPYLGFWVTEGGFRGDYNCALEPSNGYYDSISIAKSNGCLKVLAPREEIEFSVVLELFKR